MKLFNSKGITKNIAKDSVSIGITTGINTIIDKVGKTEIMKFYMYLLVYILADGLFKKNKSVNVDYIRANAGEKVAKFLSEKTALGKKLSIGEELDMLQVEGASDMLEIEGDGDGEEFNLEADGVEYGFNNNVEWEKK